LWQQVHTVENEKVAELHARTTVHDHIILTLLQQSGIRQKNKIFNKNILFYWA
jgi:hypothetical protein